MGSLLLLTAILKQSAEIPNTGSGRTHSTNRNVITRGVCAQNRTMTQSRTAQARGAAFLDASAVSYFVYLLQKAVSGVRANRRSPLMSITYDA